jgi:nucleotide-binding universal stress UspA family protein
MTEDAPMVLVGVDGSEESAEALRWALRYAGGTGGTVRAVIAWRRPMELGYYAGLGSGYGEYLPIDPQLPTDAAAATLAAIVRDTAGEKPAVAIEQRIVEGHPASVLIDQARSADLLVVGARGHSDSETSWPTAARRVECRSAHPDSQQIGGVPTRGFKSPRRSVKAANAVTMGSSSTATSTATNLAGRQLPPALDRTSGDGRCTSSGVERYTALPGQAS